MQLPKHPGLVDSTGRLIESVGELATVHEQYIPDDFLADLEQERFDSISSPAGDFHRVARVPAATADRWMREGFNIYEEPATAIIARLQKEALDKFIATKKRI